MCLSDICPITSLLAFVSASLYGIKEGLAKQEVLEFTAGKCVAGVAVTYSHHKTVLVTG